MHTATRLLLLGICPILFVAAFPTSVAPDVTPLQQVFIMKELKPGVERVGVIWDKNENHDDLMPQIQRAGAAAGVKIVIGAVSDFKEIAPMFRDLVRTNDIDVLWIVGDDKVVDSDIARKFLIKSATEHGIAVFAPSEKWVNAGAAVALAKDGDSIRLLVNKAAAQATALSIPEKYLERTQYLASN